jgi:predicted DCC family thiol-disulfide oxidoreductase YuxK
MMAPIDQGLKFMVSQANSTTFSPQSRLQQGNLIVFDDVCVLCSGFARFMAKHDKSVGFRFVGAHSPTGRKFYLSNSLDPDSMDTNIVIVDGSPHIRLASFTVAMMSLGWPWRSCVVLNFLPKRFSDWLYDRVAQNRYLFGRRSCPVPSVDLKGRLIG